MRSPENLQRGRAGDATARRRCASTRRRASTGCGFSRAWGWAPAWPTTWDWARRFRCWRLLLALKKQTRRQSRRCWSCRRRCWPTGRRRWRGSRRRCASVFVHPVRDAQGRTRSHGRQPRHGAARRRRGDHDLRHAAAAGVAAGRALAVWPCSTRPRRSRTRRPGRRKAVKRLQADARIALTGTPVENRLSDLWSLFDFLCPGLLGSQTKFKEFVKRLNEREQQPLRAAAEPGAAVHPAAAEDRPPHHRRPARQDGGAGVLRPEQAAGGAVRQAGRGAGRRAWRASTACKRRGLGAGLPDAVQADLQPSQPAAGRRALRARGQRQVRPAGGDLRGDRLAAGKGAGLHAVPRDDRTAGGLPGAGVRPPRAGAARRHGRRAAQDARRPVPARRRAAVLRAVAEGGRHGLEPDRRLARDPLRPLVEPGRREPGDRPGLPHRPEAQRAGPQVRLPRHDRGTDRRPDRRETPIGRRPAGRRRGEAADRNERRGTDPVRVAGRGSGL